MKKKLPRAFKKCPGRSISHYSSPTICLNQNDPQKEL